VTEPEQLSRQAADPDPAVGLRAVAALRHVADQLELVQVRRARELGWSWREIALRLDVTKQAAHQKYAAMLDEELRNA
jgi:hypothetical protein